jgi:DNA gyrase subunit B
VETTQVEAAIQYTDSFSESVFAFANTINTPDGGTHLTGLRTAVTRLINDYARKQGMIKEKEENFTGEDTRQGMTAIVSVKVVEPQFEGQNKLKLLNNEVRYHVETAVAEAMGRWMEENPARGARKGIIEKCRTAFRAREAAKKARDLVIRKSALESLTLPGKLADCSSRNPRNANSTSSRVTAPAAPPSRAATAASRRSAPARQDSQHRKDQPRQGAGQQRDPGADHRAGHQHRRELRPDGLRYHRIILMTDADVDGATSARCCSPFFYRYMEPLVANGHLYIAQPPLYRVTVTRRRTAKPRRPANTSTTISAGACCARNWATAMSSSTSATKGWAR